MSAGELEVLALTVADRSWVGLQLAGQRVIRASRGTDGEAASMAALRGQLAALPVVSANPRQLDQQLGRLGVESPVVHWDLVELAALLAPHQPIASAAEAMQAFELPASDGTLEGDAHALARLFGRLLDELLVLDPATVAHAVGLGAPLRWPLYSLFAELERQLARELLEGATRPAPRPPAWLTARSGKRPRRPSESRRRASRVDVDAVAAKLLPGGAIATHLAGYEPRAEQVRMAREVAEALNGGEQLLVEAGTGTGKSLAYLLPCATLAVQNNLRVVISTATTTLQDQLFDRDLAVVRAGVDHGLRACVLKGRANYLCLRRWQLALEANDLTSADRRLLLKTLFWVPRTQRGDRAELHLAPDEEEAWQRLSAVSDACTPNACAYHRLGVCFLARARRAAEDSHVIIVNHALLLSDLVSGSRVLPEYDVLVVDEAHHLEQEATDQLGWQLAPHELARRLDGLWGSHGRSGKGLVAESVAHLGQRLSPLELPQLAQGPARVAALGRDLVRLSEQLAEVVAELDPRARRPPTPARPRANGPASADQGEARRLTGGVRAGSLWRDIEARCERVTVGLGEVEAELSELRSRLEQHYPGQERARALAGELGVLQEGWARIRQRLEEGIHSPANGTIYWVTASRRGGTLHAAPLDVADLLRGRLFAPLRSAVIVSATLTVGNTFEYVEQRLGLELARGVALGSPFDFERAALLYVPNDLPDPNEYGYQQSLETVLADLIARTGGRTLVLFTSRAQLRASYLALRAPLRAAGVTVLGQDLDHASRTQLLDQFRRGEHVALFGTSSFWEGIDVVGDALCCVVLARLPFAVPTDPIYTARAEQFEQPFAEFALPHAVLRLKQGFGRLIRSRTDRGVVVVLDRRLVTRRYGRLFVDSLPPCAVEQGPSRRTGRVVTDWLARSSSDVERSLVAV
ncbi:MAG: DEAD/DEAH box helicase [Chloroflexi bacterium]|nr:DEAD/DEAH box helicase [Chloroflexota bacterium]